MILPYLLFLFLTYSPSTAQPLDHFTQESDACHDKIVITVRQRTEHERTGFHFR